VFLHHGTQLAKSSVHGVKILSCILIVQTEAHGLLPASSRKGREMLAETTHVKDKNDSQLATSDRLTQRDEANTRSHLADPHLQHLDRPKTGPTTRQSPNKAREIPPKTPAKSHVKRFYFQV
jgi:hypothetical protein